MYYSPCCIKIIILSPCEHRQYSDTCQHQWKNLHLDTLSVKSCHCVFSLLLLRPYKKGRFSGKRSKFSLFGFVNFKFVENTFIFMEMGDLNSAVGIYLANTLSNTFLQKKIDMFHYLNVLIIALRVLWIISIAEFSVL